MLVAAPGLPGARRGAIQQKGVGWGWIRERGYGGEREGGGRGGGGFQKPGQYSPNSCPRWMIHRAAKNHTRSQVISRKRQLAHSARFLCRCAIASASRVVGTPQPSPARLRRFWPPEWPFWLSTRSAFRIMAEFCTPEWFCTPHLLDSATATDQAACWRLASWCRRRRPGFPGGR
jgi:hypothetical protein